MSLFASKKRNGKGPRDTVMHRDNPNGNGLADAVYIFNGHIGPARVYYDRRAGIYSIQVFPIGGDSGWKSFYNSVERVEIFRKTSSVPGIRTSAAELEQLALDAPDYAITS